MASFIHEMAHEALDAANGHTAQDRRRFEASARLMQIAGAVFMAVGVVLAAIAVFYGSLIAAFFLIPSAVVFGVLGYDAFVIGRNGQELFQSIIQRAAAQISQDYAFNQLLRDTLIAKPLITLAGNQ